MATAYEARKSPPYIPEVPSSFGRSLLRLPPLPSRPSALPRRTAFFVFFLHGCPLGLLALHGVTATFVAPLSFSFPPSIPLSSPRSRLLVPPSNSLPLNDSPPSAEVESAGERENGEVGGDPSHSFFFPPIQPPFLSSCNPHQLLLLFPAE